MIYIVNSKEFQTLKEAVKESNAIDWDNRQFMFQPEKRIDSTITSK